MLKPEAIVCLSYKISLLPECGLSHSCVLLTKCTAPNSWDHMLITPCPYCHSDQVQLPYVWRKVKLSCICTPWHEALQNKRRTREPMAQILARGLAIPKKGFQGFLCLSRKRLGIVKQLDHSHFHIPSNSVFTTHHITWC